MAGFFHAQQAGDLALGKPPLRRFPKSATVGEALRALKKCCNELELSLWEELCPLTQKPITPIIINNNNNNNNNDAASLLPPPPHGAAVDAARPQPALRDESDDLQDGGDEKEQLWRCVGKVGMVDIICFLARDESLADLGAALKSPVAALVADTAFAVQHVDSEIKLYDALGEVLDGVQNLVVSIDRSVSSTLARYNTMPNPRRGGGGDGGGVQMIHPRAKKPHEGSPDLRQCSLPAAPRAPQEYCWLTPEDVVRYLLSCIRLFLPLPMMTIQQLGIINPDVLTVDSDADAAAALPLIQRAARGMTAVAVVEDDGGELKLVGEISAVTMKACDEMASLALAALSVRDFLSFTQDCGGPPPTLVARLHARLRQKLGDAHPATTFPCPFRGTTPEPSLAGLYGLDSGSGDEESSSDEDCAPSPTGPLALSPPAADPGRLHRAQASISKGRTAPNTCRPWSSLVAVMAQALTHRVGYIWVTDDDNSLLGIVTYLDIIHCILGDLYSPSD